MIRSLATMLLLFPTTAAAQTLQAGAWDVTSTVVDMKVPGAPGFLLRMARGKSRAEHKRLAAGNGVEALLAPDPKAKCRVDGQRVADGRYEQILACPQKKGAPLRITRIGTYDAAGFVGTAIVEGATTKGPLRIDLRQRAARVGG